MILPKSLLILLYYYKTYFFTTKSQSGLLCRLGIDFSHILNGSSRCKFHTSNNRNGYLGTESTPRYLQCSIGTQGWHLYAWGDPHLQVACVYATGVASHYALNLRLYPRAAFYGALVYPGPSHREARRLLPEP